MKEVCGEPNLHFCSALSKILLTVVGTEVARRILAQVLTVWKHCNSPYQKGIFWFEEERETAFTIKMDNASYIIWYSHRDPASLPSPIPTEYTHAAHMCTHTWADLTPCLRAHPFQDWVNHRFLLKPIKDFFYSLLWHLPSTLQKGTDEREVDAVNLWQINISINLFPTALQL